MSDDLVQRLRRWPNSVAGCTMKKAADRIEAIEAQLAKATEVVEASGRKRGELEAKLALAVEALTAIDALDPEGMVNGCSPSALTGLVLRMGEIARAAIKGTDA